VRRRAVVANATLVLGVLLTVVAMPTGALPLHVLGSVVAGLGFGASFRYAVNALGAVTPPDRRGQVFATMYIASYLAFSVPALAAGLAVERFGLEPTAVTYGLAEIALVLAATVPAVTDLRRDHRSRAVRADSG
jgi:MFS family permease